MTLLETRRLCHALLSLSLLSAIACGQEASATGKTQVLVTVDSDSRGDIARVEVQVLDVRAEVVGSAHAFEIENDDSWPVSFAVAPPRGKESGSFLVVAHAFDQSGTQISDSKGLLTFIKGKVTTAALWLLAACRGVTCGDLETCNVRGAQAGMCGSVPVLDTEVVEPGTNLPTGGAAPPTLTPPSAAASGASNDPATRGMGASTDPTSGGTVDASNPDAGMASGSPVQPGGGGVTDAGTDAQVVVPRVSNTPTLGGFSSLSEPRSNGTMLLLDDGFELGDRTCNAAGFCATASFAP
jgi:hypothetical protein